MAEPWTIREKPEPAFTGDVSAPNAATAAVVTLPAAGGDIAHVIHYVMVSYSATPTGGNLQIADGTNVLFNEDVTAAGAYTFNFVPPILCSPGTDVTITLASGAGAVVGKIGKVGHNVLSNVRTFSVLNFGAAANALLEATL